MPRLASCQTPLYATPALGLLTGLLDRVVWSIFDCLWLFQINSQLAVATNQFIHAGTNAPFRRPNAIVVQWVERQDAARAALGHGWPVAVGPRNNDEVREPAAGGPDAWGKPSWLLLGRLPEVTRRKGATQRSVVTAAGWPEGRA